MTFDILKGPIRPRMTHPVTKERRYCWMVGCAFEMAATEQCPECSQPASTHRLCEPGTCGSFAVCHHGKWDYKTPVDERMPVSKQHDGHPCTLPPHHEGPHESDASKHCATVAQALREA